MPRPPKQPTCEKKWRLLLVQAVFPMRFSVIDLDTFVSMAVSAFPLVTESLLCVAGYQGNGPFQKATWRTERLHRNAHCVSFWRRQG